MATEILTSAAARQYHLPEAERQAIQSQAPNPIGKTSPIKTMEIERQRVAFIQQSGDEFGQKNALDNA